MSLEDDYYFLLGVRQSSSPKEIKQGYLKAALIWHPDKNPGNVEFASKRFKAIVKAYGVLSDSKARLNYDRKYQSFKRNKNEEKSSKTNSSSSERKQCSGKGSKHSRSQNCRFQSRHPFFNANQGVPRSFAFQKSATAKTQPNLNKDKIFKDQKDQYSRYYPKETSTPSKQHKDELDDFYDYFTLEKIKSSLQSIINKGAQYVSSEASRIYKDFLASSPPEVDSSTETASTNTFDTSGSNDRSFQENPYSFSKSKSAYSFRSGDASFTTKKQSSFNESHPTSNCNRKCFKNGFSGDFSSRTFNETSLLSDGSKASLPYDDFGTPVETEVSLQAKRSCSNSKSKEKVESNKNGISSGCFEEIPGHVQTTSSYIDGKLHTTKIESYKFQEVKQVFIDGLLTETFIKYKDVRHPV